MIEFAFCPKEQDSNRIDPLRPAYINSNFFDDDDLISRGSTLTRVQFDIGFDNSAAAVAKPSLGEEGESMRLTPNGPVGSLVAYPQNRTTRFSAWPCGAADFRWYLFPKYGMMLMRYIQAPGYKDRVYPFDLVPDAQKGIMVFIEDLSEDRMTLQRDKALMAKLVDHSTKIKFIPPLQNPCKEVSLRQVGHVE